MWEDLLFSFTLPSNIHLSASLLEHNPDLAITFAILSAPEVITSELIFELLFFFEEFSILL